MHRTSWPKLHAGQLIGEPDQSWPRSGEQRVFTFWKLALRFKKFLVAVNKKASKKYYRCTHTDIWFCQGVPLEHKVRDEYGDKIDIFKINYLVIRNLTYCLLPFATRTDIEAYIKETLISKKGGDNNPSHYSITSHFSIQLTLLFFHGRGSCGKTCQDFCQGQEVKNKTCSN